MLSITPVDDDKYMFSYGYKSFPIMFNPPPQSLHDKQGAHLVLARRIFCFNKVSKSSNLFKIYNLSRK